MLLIIGNGFDINLGLNTRYGDFMRSISPINDTFYDSSLFQYLLEKFKKSSNQEDLRWIDLENGFKNYSKHFIYQFQENTSKVLDEITNQYELSVFNYALKTNDEFNKFIQTFKFEYNSLIKKLYSFIKLQTETKIDNQSQAYLLLQKIGKKYFSQWDFQDKKHFSTIINFNYTSKSVFEKLLKFEIENYKKTLTFAAGSFPNQYDKYMPEYKYFDIHGSLEQKNIILGIEGKSNLPEEFNFLKKGFNPNYSKNCNIEKLIKENDTIVFFGFSFGETDSPYFRQFLGSYNDKIDIYTPTDKKGFADKKIIIFHWGEIGYYQLTNRINALTEGNLDRFRQYNNVEFVDLQTFKPTSHKDFDKYF